MYIRIVNGIHRIDGNNRSLANAVANANRVHNITQVRHSPVPDCSSSLIDDDDDDDDDDDEFFHEGGEHQAWQQVCSNCGTVVDSAEDEGIFVLDM
jgi:hypothetical protein